MTEDQLEQETLSWSTDVVLVPKLQLSSLYTSVCRSLGAFATRGGQALPDCQAKPDLHCRHIPNPVRNNEI